VSEPSMVTLFTTRTKTLLMIARKTLNEQAGAATTQRTRELRLEGPAVIAGKNFTSSQARLKDMVANIVPGVADSMPEKNELKGFQRFVSIAARYSP